MDDDRFKKELLHRLDQLLILLSRNLRANTDSVEESPLPNLLRRSSDGAEDSTCDRFLMTDEMQESYNLALMDWRSKTDSK